jgi:hypothetical protein
MTSMSVQEGLVMLTQSLTTSFQGDKVCDYCHKKNHTRETCWDLHGRPTRGRSRDGGHGRSQGRGCGWGVVDQDTSMHMLLTQLVSRV